MSDISKDYQTTQMLRYWQVIIGFDKLDSVDVISIYPGLGHPWNIGKICAFGGIILLESTFHIIPAPYVLQKLS